MMNLLYFVADVASFRVLKFLNSVVKFFLISAIVCYMSNFIRFLESGYPEFGHPKLTDRHLYYPCLKFGGYQESCI